MLAVLMNLCRVPELGFDHYATNEFQRLSYRMYLWLRQQDFNVIHFPALGGVGYYTLVAKHQGLFPSATRLLVSVQEIPGGEMGNLDRELPAKAPIFEAPLLVQDFMQQRSAEFAVCIRLM